MKLTTRKRESLEINLTSLIDVVFLLLIFFMVTTTFERHSRLRIDLPEASQDAIEARADRVEIAVTADGRVYVNNNEVVNSKIDTIKTAIVRLAGDDRSLPVSIRADANSAHQHFVTVMSALSDLGFVNVSIATTPLES